MPVYRTEFYVWTYILSVQPRIGTLYRTHICICSGRFLRSGCGTCMFADVIMAAFVCFVMVMFTVVVMVKVMVEVKIKVMV